MSRILLHWAMRQVERWFSSCPPFAHRLIIQIVSALAAGCLYFFDDNWLVYGDAVG